MQPVSSIDGVNTETNALFLTIEVLDEAISLGKQVRFHYDEFGTDKKLHHRKTKDGKDREYIINPYQIAAANGRYYLVCNYDGYDDLSNYRIDRISDIELLETNVKPVRELEGMKYGFNLKKYIDEHIYMWSGKTIRAKFIAEKYILNDVMDYFGGDVRLSDETETTITVSVRVNEQDIRIWAMQFSADMTYLEPESFVEKCRETIMKAAERYK